MGSAMYRQMSAYDWSVCDSKANSLPIIAECASTTPLNTLTPDVIFIPNEIEIFNRLHVSYHPQET